MTMKVLQINSVCGVGSTGRIAYDLSQEMTRAGIDNRIFYGVGQSDYKLSRKFGGVVSLRTHQLGTRLTGRHGFFSTHTTREMVQAIREYDPDIIHLHNIHGHYLNMEVLFRFLAGAGKPVVWTLHDCWAFTGHCAYFDAAGCNKWKTGCHHCPQRRAYPDSWIFDRSRNNWAKKKNLFGSVSCLHLVTPSQWLADLTRDSFLSHVSVSVIHNGIDLSVFTPTAGTLRQQYAPQGQKIVLGVAMGWEERKGLRDLLELGHRLGDGFRVVLIGLRDDQIASLPEGVLGITRTNSPQQLAQYYSAADVYVNPTYEDNFPTTNLEALACGTPVVTYDTGGSPEAVDEHTGVVVPRGDLDELQKAVETAAQGMVDSNACCERAKQFDRRLTVERYIRLYQSMANAKKTT